MFGEAEPVPDSFGVTETETSFGGLEALGIVVGKPSETSKFLFDEVGAILRGGNIARVRVVVKRNPGGFGRGRTENDFAFSFLGPTTRHF